MDALFPVILDGLVLLFLIAAILFSARLSLQLKTFRDSRKELEALLHDLSGQVDKAEGAIEGLRENARQSGREMQNLINEAAGLRDELQLMTEAGDGLAGRLERVIDRRTGQGAGNELSRREASARAPVRTGGKSDKSSASGRATSSFAIRDPEFDENLEDSGYDEQGLLPGEETDAPDEQSLHSQAERDLYEALRGKKRKKTGAGHRS